MALPRLEVSRRRCVHFVHCDADHRANPLVRLERAPVWRLARFHARTLFCEGHRCSHLHARRSALSWLAQHARRRALLPQVRRNGRGSGALGESPAFPGHSRKHRCHPAIAQAEHLTFLAPLGSAAVLHVFGRLELGAHFYPSVVATLLVQHPLRHGNAANLRVVSGVPCGLAHGSDRETLATAGPTHPARFHGADYPRLLCAHAFYAPGPA